MVVVAIQEHHYHYLLIYILLCLHSLEHTTTCLLLPNRYSLYAEPFIVSVNEFGFCIDVGLFDRSVYEPVNATVFKSAKNFFILPNNVLSVSPLAILVRVPDSANSRLFGRLSLHLVHCPIPLVIL